MQRHVLITGGAGFIGSHLADESLRHGHCARALDNRAPQLHGPAWRDAGRPDYLSPEVELIIGDMRVPDAVRRALQGVDAVYHFAAMAGKERIRPQISGRYRAGDIRHCFADIALARQAMNYESQVGIEEKGLTP